MKDPQQIAAEAWDAAYNAHNEQPCRAAAIAIIQAAIEKGYCAGVDAMTQAGIEAVAHASEDEKDLTAVPVLAETARPGICDATTEGGEARESTETIGRDLPVKQDYRGGSQPL